MTLMAPYVARAGDLIPPPGPITATHRTPISDASTPGNASSLFRITQPGSYYLRAGITGVAAKNGIQILSGNVTLDLMGFELNGVVGSGSLDGINTVAALTSVHIHNGVVRGWGSRGINLVLVSNSQLKELRVDENGGVGIYVGSGSAITNCTAQSNGSDGIATGVGCTITGCTAQGNAADGIDDGGESTVTGCAANTNGEEGIEVGAGTSVTSCSSYNNMGDGIRTPTGVTGAGCTINNCTSRFNRINGIRAEGGSSVIGCNATANDVDGILVANSTVRACTVSYNDGDGIQASSNCMLIDNHCVGNGNGAGDGAGIHTTSSDNHIEGNTAIDNDRGIDVDTGGNLIIRNTAAGNTGAGAFPLPDFDLTGTNSVGQILDATAGGDITSSIAWRNIVY